MSNPRTSNLKRTIALRDAKIRELTRELSASHDKSDALQEQISDLEIRLTHARSDRGYNP